jgi:hypothetical protein
VSFKRNEGDNLCPFLPCLPAAHLLSLASLLILAQELLYDVKVESIAQSPNLNQKLISRIAWQYNAQQMLQHDPLL